MTTSHQQGGAIGGLTRAATAATRAEITHAARDAQWQRFLDQVPDGITDPAERQRRAELPRPVFRLRRGDLARRADHVRAARAVRARELGWPGWRAAAPDYRLEVSAVAGSPDTERTGKPPGPALEAWKVYAGPVPAGYKDLPEDEQLELAREWAGKLIDGLSSKPGEMGS